MARRSTLTATVSTTDTAAGTPSGTVQFQIDGTDVGAATALVKGTASIVVPGLNATNYQITANYSSDTVDFTGSSASGVLPVNPAPVFLTAQANSVWLLSGQDLSVVVTASTIAGSNGTLLTPDGAVTFYDNGVALVSQPLAVVTEQDQAVLDTATLPLGRNVITMGYTSASGNFAMTAASPVLTEIIFPAGSNVLTVDNTSSDPTVVGSLPWAVAQADASNVAALIIFARASGQAFATPQTITLETPLDVSDANFVGMLGPSCGRDPGGRLQPVAVPDPQRGASRQPFDSGRVYRPAESGANGDLQVAGVLDVFEPATNLGSALNVTGGGTVDLGGQTLTADSLTLTDGSVADGTLSSGTRTVLSGTVSANLTGTGGLVKDSTGTVVLSGNEYLFRRHHGYGGHFDRGWLEFAAQRLRPDGERGRDICVRSEPGHGRCLGGRLPSPVLGRGAGGEGHRHFRRNRLPSTSGRGAGGEGDRHFRRNPPPLYLRERGRG